MLAVGVLSDIGIALTAYLLYQHYRSSGSSFCNISEYLNCDIVNKSTYSEIFGIPVALFGLFAYLVIGLIAYGLSFGFDFRKIHRRLWPGMIIKLLYWFVAIGLLFSLYLTYVEFFILQALCIFCLSHQAIILIIFVILMGLRYSIADDVKRSGSCEYC